MPDQPIRALPDAVPLSDGDFFAVDQAAPPTAKATVAEVRDACTKQRVDVLTTDAINTFWGQHFVIADTIIGSSWTDLPLSAATTETLGAGSLLVLVNLRMLQPTTYAAGGTFEVDFQVGGYLQPGVYQTLVFSAVQGQDAGFTFNVSIALIVEDSGPLTSSIMLRARRLGGAISDMTVGALHSIVTVLSAQIIRAASARVVQGIDDLGTESGDSLITESGDSLITEG